MQASIIGELSKFIRSGKFCSSASKIVLLGHSLGSVMSNSVLHSDPGLVDAEILTGVAYYGVIGTIGMEAKQL
jgi:hypothetical protein